MFNIGIRKSGFPLGIQIILSAWILATSYWIDNGVWNDLSSWID